jgi:hypothetical protein
MLPSSIQEREVENLSPARERYVYRSSVTVRGLAEPTFRATGIIDKGQEVSLLAGPSPILAFPEQTFEVETGGNRFRWHHEVNDQSHQHEARP